MHYPIYRYTVRFIASNTAVYTVDKSMIMDNISSIGAVVGGGFFGGLLLGYALKKVVKLIVVIVGLFIAGLAYLQYQQIASFNWDRIEGTISTIANVTTNTLNDYSIESLAMTNLGITLTGGMSAGFAIGFMKG
jgi:uncharacterized membrane protein (Fun14 family)